MAKKTTTTESVQPTNEVPTELTYGDTKLTIANIPMVSQIALMARGVSHILGNEVASKVKGKKDAHQSDWAKQPEETRGEYVPPTESQIAEWTQAYRDEAVAKIMDGKLGVRTGGPRGSQIDTIIRQVAVEELRANLAKAKAKLPVKATDTITVGGKPMTRTDLIDAYVAKHGERLKAEAERRMAETAGVEVDLDDLI